MSSNEKIKKIKMNIYLISNVTPGRKEAEGTDGEKKILPMESAVENSRKND
jgi:hypothetical protein